MPCLLHISGESFDPSTVPELSALKPFSVYRRGDRNPSGPGPCEVGGVSCELSSCEDLLGMVGDVSYQLTRHRALLGTLSRNAAVRYRTLVFHLGEGELDELGGRITLPPLLLLMCAEADLGVSLQLP